MNNIIWKNFRRAVRDYELVNDGDKIGVCISGGKDSTLLAVYMKQLQREIDFEAEYIDIIERNLEKFGITAEISGTKIFESIKGEKNPCFLCSRLRRGWLYRTAEEKCLNKIALGHHFDDAVETILMGMLYGSQMQAMLPKLKAEHYSVEVIRPLYRVRERDIIEWAKESDTEFIACECGLDGKSSKRAEIKDILEFLRQKNPDVDMNIFRSAENVNLKKLLSYHNGDDYHSFLDD